MLIKRMSKEIFDCVLRNADFLHNFYHVSPWREVDINKPHGAQLFTYLDCELLKNDSWFKRLQNSYTIGEPAYIIADPHKFYTEMLEFIPAEELGDEPGLSPNPVMDIIAEENAEIEPVYIELEKLEDTVTDNLPPPSLKRSDMQDLMGNL